MPKKEKLKIKDIIKAVTDSKGMLSAAANKLGVDYSTLWRYSKKYPKVQEAITNQKESVTDMAELKLFKAIREGEAWAICFYLKTQGKNRGYVERIEQTGKDGKDYIPQINNTIIKITQIFAEINAINDPERRKKLFATGIKEQLDVAFPELPKEKPPEEG